MLHWVQLGGTVEQFVLALGSYADYLEEKMTINL